MNRGLLRVVRQINPYEAQEILWEPWGVFGGIAHILLLLKSLISECSQ